jgi:hypothetical protein
MGNNWEWARAQAIRDAEDRGKLTSTMSDLLPINVLNNYKHAAQSGDIDKLNRFLRLHDILYKK